MTPCKCIDQFYIHISISTLFDNFKRQNSLLSEIKTFKQKSRLLHALRETLRELTDVGPCQHCKQKHVKTTATTLLVHQQSYMDCKLQ